MTKKLAVQGVYRSGLLAGAFLLTSIWLAPYTVPPALAQKSNAVAVGSEADLLSRARRAGSEYRYDEGCELLSRILTKNPKNADAHYLFALFRGRQNQYLVSVDHAKKCLKLRPDYASAHSVLGRSLAGLGDLKGAEAELTEAVRLDSKNALSYFNLATVKGMQEDYKSALAYYKKASEIAPKYSQAYLGMASACAKMGDQKGQIAACRQAVESAPESALAHGRLGSALSQNGDMAGAFSQGLKANMLRVKDSWNDFLGMFLAAWASVFLAFAAIFAVLFAGSRFKPQEGEIVLKSFFLTFYKDKPGRFVVTDTRIVFVPEAFSAWFGATRVSIQRPQIESINYLSTVGGGTVSILTRDKSVHQFRMPLLVLDPVRSLLVSQGLTAPDPDSLPSPGPAPTLVTNPSPLNAQSVAEGTTAAKEQSEVSSKPEPETAKDSENS